jgi:hypothetical protein
MSRTTHASITIDALCPTFAHPIYAYLDPAIVTRISRIAAAVNEVRVPANTSDHLPEFPDVTLETMRNILVFVKSYWRTYEEQEAPNGVGLSRQSDSALRMLSAIVPAVNFLLFTVWNKGVIALANWLKFEKEPAGRKLSKDETDFIAQIRRLLNLMAELHALSLKQSEEWSSKPDHFEFNLRRMLAQISEWTADQAVRLLEYPRLSSNPALAKWRERLADSRLGLAIVLAIGVSISAGRGNSEIAKIRRAFQGSRSARVEDGQAVTERTTD